MSHHDLLIIGAGSGNTVIGPEHDHLDIAIAEPWAFGGTCMNRGCIPSKMLVHAADLAVAARHAPELGVHTTFEGADWPAIRDRIFGRIDPIAEAGLAYRHGLDNVTVYEAEARFTGERTLDIGGTHTSDTVMRVDELPVHLVVLGGGYIALEMAHVFEGLGSRVTIVHRGDLLLRRADQDVRRRITDLYAGRLDVRLETEVESVRYDGAYHLDLTGGTTLDAEALLVATGRRPNGDRLALEAGGVAVDADGYVTTDEFLRTSAEGVWALGDVTNPAQLKHTANAEARVLAHNLLHPGDLHAIDRRFTPSAVFGHPQIASVGPTEAELAATGRPYLVAARDYADTAYGWAMEDRSGFVKVLADPDSRHLLGAHLLGPQAPTLVQQLIQGMAHDLTVDQMARGQLYIHPAMPEVVEQALGDGDSGVVRVAAGGEGVGLRVGRHVEPRHR